MASNPKLTDEEVCRKFGIERDDPNFATAKGLAYNRHDRVICEVPACQCPHCCHEFTATFYDLGSNDPANGDELPCPGCDRIIYIEHIAEPEDGDEDKAVYVTLNTDPRPPE